MTVRKRVAFTAALLTAGLLVLAAPVLASAPDGDTIAKIKLKTKLSGDEEVPGPGDTDGKGQFKATLKSNKMCYKFKAKKIAAPTMAHIHDGDAGATGPVVITLLLPTKQGVKECLTAVPDEEDTNVTMSVSELEALKTASIGFYTNVHNADFPAGAIRGQLD